MNSVRLFSVIVGCALMVVGSVAHAAAGPMRPSARERARHPALSATRRDSLRCVSGAAASDATPEPAVTAARRRFAPRWAQANFNVTVHISEQPAIAGWTPAYREEVLAALRAWDSAGAPVVFDVVPDSAPADVRIHWLDRFLKKYDGWTTVTWNQSGRLVGADVTLAVHSPGGQLLTAGERDQVMLHEIGHVLGLAHSSNPASIMRANVKATAIANVDIQTLHALYDRAYRPPLAASKPERAAAGGRCDEGR